MKQILYTGMWVLAVWIVEVEMGIPRLTSEVLGPPDEAVLGDLPVAPYKTLKGRRRPPPPVPPLPEVVAEEVTAPDEEECCPTYEEDLLPPPPPPVTPPPPPPPPILRPPSMDSVPKIWDLVPDHFYVEPEHETHQEHKRPRPTELPSTAEPPNPDLVCTLNDLSHEPTPPTLPPRPPPRPLSQENKDDGLVYLISRRKDDGEYFFDFLTKDSTRRTEKGYFKKTNEPKPRLAHVKEGSYAYTSPEGKKIKTEYFADENGYRVYELNIS